MQSKIGRISTIPGVGRVLAVLLTAGLVLTAVPAAVGGDSKPAVRSAKSTAKPLDRSILDDPGRPEKEKAQDGGRKALDVYEWIGIEPGMAVVDLFCSGGYNTHLLSKVVGDQGKVYSVFEFYSNKELYDGRLYKVDSLTERVAENKLENVELLMEISDLPENSVDAILVVRNYHDVEWVFPGLKRQDAVAGLLRALKPGGVVGIVEVSSDKPGWDKDTHRLNEKVVIEDFTNGGFAFVGDSDLLANPDDDKTTSGFDVGRYKMDRYLLKFQKPV